MRGFRQVSGKGFGGFWPSSANKKRFCFIWLQLCIRRRFDRIFANFNQQEVLSLYCSFRVQKNIFQTTFSKLTFYLLPLFERIMFKTKHHLIEFNKSYNTILCTSLKAIHITRVQIKTFYAIQNLNSPNK